MSQGNATVSFEQITGGVGIGVANAPVTTTIHLPPERVETPPSPSSTVPFVHDPDYINRPPLRNELSDKLSGPGARVALVGLGGAGKTQLAVEYVRDVREQSPETWVLWLSAGTAARFEQSVRDIADVTKIYGRRDAKANIFQLVRNWLCDAVKGRWVVVLDNVDDASFLLATPPASAAEGQSRRLIDYIPACEHGSVLITTRSRTVARRMVPGGQVIEVPPMDNMCARALLEKKLGVEESQSHGRLAAALDFLPLAMAQAAAYIHERRPRSSVEQYLQELERSGRSRAGLLRRDERFPGREYEEASSSILMTWHISFEHIAKTRRSAADLLSVMSFCDRQAIPEILVRNNDDEKEVDVSFEEDVTILCNFSFISATTHQASWEMHRLVQDATRMWLENQTRYQDFRDFFLFRLNQVLPSGRYENWTRCQVLFPHAEAAAGYTPSDTGGVSDWTAVMYNAAWYAQLKGQWAKAEVMAVASMQARKNMFGGCDERTIDSMEMLSGIFSDMGRWKEAEELRVKVMNRRQAKLGLDHPHTLISMGNLALTYGEQGRWKEAEELEVEVMDRRQATMAPSHPDTLTSMANLAVTYWNHGRWKEAEELGWKAMERRQATLGLDHPDTLASMGNLALTYHDQERWKEAEELEVKVMERRQATLGSDHPDTLASMGNLALTYGEQGKWKEAEELEVKAMEMRQATQGFDHPDTLKSMGNLAATYWNHGRWKEAEELQTGAVGGMARVLGEDHPDMTTSTANLEYFRINQEEPGAIAGGLTLQNGVQRDGLQRTTTESRPIIAQCSNASGQGNLQKSEKWWQRLKKSPRN